jgi:enamine deaminase RidA (YjgF/YER057c/UK114 family)
MTAINERLAELGLTLPPPPPLGGEYVRAVRAGGLLFLSGAGPYDGGAYAPLGKVDSEVPVDAARAAARTTILNALASAEAELGSLDRVERVVRLFGMVNSDPAFTAQPHVIDAASELLVEIFGAKGRHVRSAVGMAALPLGICVEIELTLAVS